MKKLKQSFLHVIVAIVGLLTIAWPANAVQSPVGCNANRLNLSITKDKTAIKEGETITYTITASNLNGGPAIACDIDSALVTVTLPGLDGNPTGSVVTLETNASYPAGFPITVIGTVPYVVNVNPGVTDVVAQARIFGILHDAPVDHTAEIIKTVGTAIIEPEIPPVTPPTTTTPTSVASTSTPRMPNAGVVALAK